MSPGVIGLATVVSTSIGSLLGMWTSSRLPEHHLDEASRDTVKTGIGLIATMTALVLGLVTASAKSSFDAADTAVKLLAVDVLTLDRALARYGSENQGHPPIAEARRRYPHRSHLAPRKSEAFES
jgi:hypothetical protein